MSTHTPGPLHIGKYPTSVIAADGFPLADIEEFPVLENWEELGIGHWSEAPGKASIERPEGEAGANARRVVATWNACEGIPTDALECQTKKGLTKQLIENNSELLTTLEGCMKAMARMIDKHDPDSIEAEWIGHANEAIHNAKREK